MLRVLVALIAALVAFLAVPAFAQVSNSARPVSPAKQEAEEKAQLIKLRREYESTKRVFQQRPSAASRRAHVRSTVRLATATMTSLALLPKEKYPQALRLYREALKLDPTNREAKNNSEMIEQIYKSMGRPIPR